MPRAEIPEGYAKVTSQGANGPTTWANVMYFQVVEPAATEIETAQDLAQAMLKFYLDVVEEANLLNGWTLSTQKVLYRNTADSVTRYVTAADAIGSGGTAEQAGQVAYLFNWHTGDPRRGGKARQYIAGVPDAAMQDTANLNAGLVSAMSSRIPTWFDNISSSVLANGSKLLLVQMSFVNAKADRVTPVAYSVGSGTVNPVVGTQRRRVDRLRS
jgi:hypothetical protein